MKKLRFSLKEFVLSMLLTAALAALLALFAGMPFWVAFAIAVAALLVNGLVAEIEDRRPGGFLNPKGKSK